MSTGTRLEELVLDLEVLEVDELGVVAAGEGLRALGLVQCHARSRGAGLLRVWPYGVRLLRLGWSTVYQTQVDFAGGADLFVGGDEAGVYGRSPWRR